MEEEKNKGSEKKSIEPTPSSLQEEKIKEQTQIWSKRKKMNECKK